MPLYQYKCEKCGNKIEVLQNIGGIAQLCCGKTMVKVPVRLAGASGKRWDDMRGHYVYTKGYKEGYIKDLQR